MYLNSQVIEESTNNEVVEMWIEFQQTKYICRDGKHFQPVSFPVDLPIQVYYFTYNWVWLIVII